MAAGRRHSGEAQVAIPELLGSAGSAGTARSDRPADDPLPGRRRFSAAAFRRPDGNPTGFSVELARAACERLAITCTVQVRRFDLLLDALRDRQGDVVAAAIPTTASLRERFCGHRPLFQDSRPASPSARTGTSRRPEREALPGKASGWSGERPTRPLPRLHGKGHLQALSGPGGGRGRAEGGRDRLPVRGRPWACPWIGGEEFGRMLRILRRALSGEPVFRRRHRFHHPQGRRELCAGPSTSRSSSSGRRANTPSSICGSSLSPFTASPLHARGSKPH